MSRTALVRIQFLVGVMNAYGCISSIAAGDKLGAILSAACVLIVAIWRIPPKAKD